MREQRYGEGTERDCFGTWLRAGWRRRGDDGTHIRHRQFEQLASEERRRATQRVGIRVGDRELDNQVQIVRRDGRLQCVRLIRP